MCKEKSIDHDTLLENIPVQLDEATILDQMRKQMPRDIEYLLSEGLIDPKLFEKPIIGKDGTQKGINYYYSSLNMTSAHFYTVLRAWKAENYTTSIYNGVNCFKFTSGADNIYVAVTAFYPNLSEDYNLSGYSPSLASFSTSVSNNLNTDYTDPYYIGSWVVYRAVGVPQVQLAVYGVDVAKNLLIPNVKLTYQAVDQYNFGFNSPSALKYPILELAITNTGTGGEYLHSLEIKGTGKCDKTDISSLVTLGYTAVKLAASAAVSGLTFIDYASLIPAVSPLLFTLEKGTYSTPDTTLSNPSIKRYVYSEKTQSPLAITSQGNYLQGIYTLNGNKIDKTTKYKVTISKANK